LQLHTKPFKITSYLHEELTYMSERISNPKISRVALASLVAGAAIAGVVAGVYDFTTSPIRAYERQYTGNGGCLDHSPYDVNEGAQVITRNIDGQVVLTAVPEKANTHTPSVLDLVVHKTGVLSIKLARADHETGALLAKACGEVDGY
jgi:hypothetical protein